MTGIMGHTYNIGPIPIETVERNLDVTLGGSLEVVPQVGGKICPVVELSNILDESAVVLRQVVSVEVHGVQAQIEVC